MVRGLTLEQLFGVARRQPAHRKVTGILLPPIPTLASYIHYTHCMRASTCCLPAPGGGRGEEGGGVNGMQWNGIEWNGMQWIEWNGVDCSGTEWNEME